MELFLALMTFTFGAANLLISSRLKRNGAKISALFMAVGGVLYFAIGLFCIGAAIFAPDLIY